MCIEFAYINKFESTYMNQELHSGAINLVSTDVTLPHWRISKTSRYYANSSCSDVRLKRNQLNIKSISHCNAFLKQEEKVIDIEPCVEPLSWLPVFLNNRRQE